MVHKLEEARVVRFEQELLERRIDFIGESAKFCKPYGNTMQFMPRAGK